MAKSGNRPSAEFGKLTRQDVLDLFHRDATGAVVDIGRRDDKTGHIFVHSPVFTSQATFNLFTHVMDITTFQVRGEREHGTGRREAEKLIRFGAGSGMNVIRTKAGDSAGGYFWPKMGFEADDVGTPEFNILTRAICENRLRAAGPFLNAPETQMAASALTFRNPKSVWEVADLLVDLGPRVRKIFDKIKPNIVERAQTDSLRDVFSRGAMTTDARLGAEMMDRVREGKRLMLGRYLLAGTSRDSVFRPNDPVAWKRFQDFTRG